MLVQWHYFILCYGWVINIPLHVCITSSLFFCWWTFRLLPCHGLCGKRIWKGADTCVCITDSLCCTPETNTTLSINYAPVKKTKTQSYQLVCHNASMQVTSVTSDSVTPWTVACQAPLSMWFPRQEYWSGLLCPPPEDPSDSGIESTSPEAPALAGRFFTHEPLGKPSMLWRGGLRFLRASRTIHIPAVFEWCK